MVAIAVRDVLRDRTPLVARLALAAIVVGALLTWTVDGPVRLSGIEGPNDGWLVLLLALFALGWTRWLARPAWTGIIGVLGASLVIFWTAISAWRDNHDVVGASPGVGVLVVITGSIVLGACAVLTAVRLVQIASETG